MALIKLNNQSLSAVTSAGLPTGSVLDFKQANAQSGQATIGITGTAATGASVLYGATLAGRTYVEAQSVTITPKSTSSILYCYGMVGWTSMNATSTMGHGQIITLNDTTAIDNSDFPHYMHSAITSSTGYYYPSTFVVGIFSPASTSAQTIRLRPFVYVETPNTAQGSFKASGLFVTEIAA